MTEGSALAQGHTLSKKMVNTARRREEEEEETHKKTKITQLQQQEEGDMISQLPDDIILPILTLLTLKEACITSSLSKRWRSLFPSLPRLHLDHFSFCFSSVRENALWDKVHEIDIGGWLESVWAIIESRRAPVRICTIRSSYFDQYHEDFDNIISFLCNDGIEELTIYSIGKRYSVPSYLYFSRTLTRIELHNCILKVPSKFTGLRRLNALKLEECIVEDGDMQRLIMGCRDVERLTLEHCHRLRNLTVDADKLAVLDVRLHSPRPLLALSIGNAPRLESVTVGFRCDYRVNYPTFLDGDPEDSSDTDDGTSTDAGGDATDESVVSRLVRLLESLGNVHNLSLEFHHTYLKYMRLEEVEVPLTLRSPLTKMKRLTLKMQPDSTSVASIVSCLLNSCPNLEDLVLGDNKAYTEYDYPDWWDQPMHSDCMRNTLSTVTLCLDNGGHWKYWIELIEFLMENARVLKKLVIDCHRPMRSILEDVQMDLLLLEPASPDAVVELKTDRRLMFHLV